MKLSVITLITLFAMNTTPLKSQVNPLWQDSKAKNYLPHMTFQEVKDFLEVSDMVIIPIGAIEQHSYHLPLGTDIINGVERCKLIASERDILVAPVLFAGQSPYHMAFPGTITLKAETIIQVHMEAVESLVRHGFRRFIIMASHGGNTAIVKIIVDQINQTTAGVAVDFSQAISPFMKNEKKEPQKLLDRHAGTGETSNSLYLMPSLVQMDKVQDPPKLNLPDHMRKMVPDLLEGDPTATLLFLAEGLKAEETGKKTSTIEMSKIGVYGERSPVESSTERGKENTDNLVQATVKFIDAWNSYKK